jgi:hypothetical protein
MENVKNLTNAINLLAAKTIKGTSFVGLRTKQTRRKIKPNNYSGYYYENCLVSDLTPYK